MSKAASIVSVKETRSRNITYETEQSRRTPVLRDDWRIGHPASCSMSRRNGLSTEPSAHWQTVVDPEVLAREAIEGTQREWGLGGDTSTFPENIWILKVKIVHFYALRLCTDFKICRLQSVHAKDYNRNSFDHIRKTVTNRLVFLPFFRSSESSTR